MSGTVLNVTPQGQSPGDSNPCPGSDPLDSHLQVVESSARSDAGVAARVSGFAPFTGERLRTENGIADNRLSSAHNAVMNRGDHSVDRQDGPDIAMTLRNCQDGKTVSSELANYGARTDNTDGQLSNGVFNTGVVVIRVWKNNEYLQFDNNTDELIFGPSTTQSGNTRQGFQLQLTALGNLGLNKYPEHRIDLGQNPCDKEGRKIKGFGAQLGYYILLKDRKCKGKFCKLTCKKGHLYVNGKKVLTSDGRRRHDSCGCDSSSTSD